VTKRGADDLEFRPLSQQLAGTMFDQSTAVPASPSLPSENRREARASSDLDRKRDEVLAAYRKYGPMTPDACADRLGWSILETRPRCTELAGTKKQLEPLLMPVGEGVSSLGNPMTILDLASRVKGAAA
jgi:hypothetical protein